MITSYATLQTSVANWLNRTDLTAPVKEFIQLAEAEFKRDDKLRKLQDRGTFTISADGQDLPSDYQSLESWWHDGETYYGEIETVGAEQLGTLKVRMGVSGVPRYAALVDGSVWFAPEPDGSYETRMIYWRTITDLSDTNTTNWLLDAHPDVYLFGALVQAAPFLKDDMRLPLWQAQLDRAKAGVHLATQNAQWSGSMKRASRTTFGG